MLMKIKTLWKILQRRIPLRFRVELLYPSSPGFQSLSGSCRIQLRHCPNLAVILLGLSLPTMQ